MRTLGWRSFGAAKTIVRRGALNSVKRTHIQIVALAIAAALALALTMLGGLPEVTAQSTEDPRAHITVEIRDGDDTVSWSDPDNCSSDYNLYLDVNSRSNDVETTRKHLGSATSNSTQASVGISYTAPRDPTVWVQTVPYVKVELYCGEYSSSSNENDLVASTDLAFDDLDLRAGTYSSAPMTALSLSDGTLSPSFNRGIYRYETVVPRDEPRLTLGPTVLSGYEVIYVKNPSVGVLMGCDIGGCHYSYGDQKTTGVVLADADPGTAGFQVELDNGENRFGMGVNKGQIETGPGSLYSLTVTFLNVPATGRPAISGTVQVGKTLTANTSRIADENGLNRFLYQWLRVNGDSTETEIANATRATYRLASADVGKTIKVRIGFTDRAGNDESLTSYPTAKVTEASASSADATLSALTLSGVHLGTFEPAVTSYTARVANSVTETTVSPTVNHSAASQVIKLGGTTDSDGTLSLAVGSNVITVEVTAEDGQTTKTYTITVTRVDSQTSISSDASLSGLSLSGMDFGTFSTSTTSYSAAVGNGVANTTVTPTPTHAKSGYVIKLNGITDSDGILPLRVGSNVITVEVTAEDGFTAQTYTATITRAEPPSTDATLKSLTINDDYYGPNDLVEALRGLGLYHLGYEVTEVTVTPTVNHPEATYVIKVEGVVDDDGVFALPEPEQGETWSRVSFTVEVTAEDVESTLTYYFNFGVSGLAPTSSAPTGEPTISGTAQVGQTLTADTSGISDDDGLANVSYSYQWIRNDGSTDSDITGATSSTYALVSADEGKTIKVRVSFTDG